jgi:transcriptional regulator with PAS, ATPase and Fis domain
VQRMLAANPFATRIASAPLPITPTTAVEEISLETLERRHIQQLLARHQNITRVAAILQINRRTLQRKLKAWGVEHDESV